MKKKDIIAAIERRKQQEAEQAIEEADAKFNIRMLKSTHHFEDEGK